MSNDISYDYTVCHTLTFTCGEGTIEISMNDGSVKFNNCSPPESGRAFWEAVTMAFPMVAEQIRKSP
jgi:hypothetical protein